MSMNSFNVFFTSASSLPVALPRPQLVTVYRVWSRRTEHTLGLSLVRVTLVGKEVISDRV